MKKLSEIIQKSSAFTLVELLVVLAIVSSTMALMMYGVVKFRQVITVSSASKELVIQLRKTRRDAIDSVVKAQPGSATFPVQKVLDEYYIKLNGTNNYNSGARYKAGAGIIFWNYDDLKSFQYNGVNITDCVDTSNGASYRYVVFSQGTGEIGFDYSTSGYFSTYFVQGRTCKIKLSIAGGGVSTSRDIVVNSVDRSISIEY